MEYNLTLQNHARNTVFIELFDDRPLTRDNFLQYVNGGVYDGSMLHRLARNFVIQGGGFYPELVAEPAPLNVSLDPNARVDLDGNPATPNPNVMNEFGNMPFRTNARGTLAMAKIGGNPNSATSEYFVNLGNNSANLDNNNGGFTVFAQVVGDGMALIDGLSTLPIIDLNPDVDDDGTRDLGPFGRSASDGVPVFVMDGSFLTVVLEEAQRVDYFGVGPITNIPGAGMTISARDAFIDTGALFSGLGKVVIGEGRTLGIRESYLLNRRLENRGTLAPGLQIGSVHVQTYQQFASGTLDIQLRETTPNTEHDRLVVTGVAQLAGKLDVSLMGTFSPTHGDMFTILSAPSFLGTFSTIDLPMLAEGFVWDVNQGATTLTLGVSGGDYNRDGVVDAADYTVWREMLNTTVTVNTFVGADGNGDGLINNLDYAIWKNNFGNVRGTVMGGGASLAQVPEPASTGLVLAAAAMGLTVRRARPRRRTAVGSAT